MSERSGGSSGESCPLRGAAVGCCLPSAPAGLWVARRRQGRESRPGGRARRRARWSGGPGPASAARRRTDRGDHRRVASTPRHQSPLRARGGGTPGPGGGDGAGRGGARHVRGSDSRQGPYSRTAHVRGCGRPHHDPRRVQHVRLPRDRVDLHVRAGRSRTRALRPRGGLQVHVPGRDLLGPHARRHRRPLQVHRYPEHRRDGRGARGVPAAGARGARAPRRPGVPSGGVRRRTQALPAERPGARHVRGGGARRDGARGRDDGDSRHVRLLEGAPVLRRRAVVHGRDGRRGGELPREQHARHATGQRPADARLLDLGAGRSHRDAPAARPETRGGAAGPGHPPGEPRARQDRASVAGRPARRRAPGRLAWRVRGRSASAFLAHDTRAHGGVPASVPRVLGQVARARVALGVRSRLARGRGPDRFVLRIRLHVRMAATGARERRRGRAGRRRRRRAGRLRARLRRGFGHRRSSHDARSGGRPGGAGVASLRSGARSARAPGASGSRAGCPRPACRHLCGLDALEFGRPFARRSPRAVHRAHSSRRHSRRAVVVCGYGAGQIVPGVVPGPDGLAHPAGSGRVASSLLPGVGGDDLDVVPPRGRGTTRSAGRVLVHALLRSRRVPGHGWADGRDSRRRQLDPGRVNAGWARRGVDGRAAGSRLRHQGRVGRRSHLGAWSVRGVSRRLLVVHVGRAIEDAALRPDRLRRASSGGSRGSSHLGHRAGVRARLGRSDHRFRHDAARGTPGGREAPARVLVGRADRLRGRGVCPLHAARLDRSALPCGEPLPHQDASLPGDSGGRAPDRHQRHASHGRADKEDAGVLHRRVGGHHCALGRASALGVRGQVVALHGADGEGVVFRRGAFDVRLRDRVPVPLQAHTFDLPGSAQARA